MISIKRIGCAGILRDMHIRSLVSTTGLLVSVGLTAAMTFLTGCADEAVMYDLAEISTDTEQDSLVTDRAGQEEGTDPYADAVSDKEKETGQAEDEKETVLVVHLCGAVNEPGVYELDLDSRIIDGINEAGGFTEDASRDALNLAMELTDGSRIYVPTESEVKDGTVLENELVTTRDETSGYVTGSVAVTGQDTGGKVNINTADIAALTSLPGIGESKAKSIIAYREEHGGFKSIEEIMNVSGIGQKSFEKLKSEITV